MKRYARFPVEDVILKPFNAERRSKTLRSMVVDPYKWYASLESYTIDPEMEEIVKAINTARDNGRPVIVFIGGHVIKTGMAMFLADLVLQDKITHIAGNGSVAIHDMELSVYGHTSEDVAEYIRDGRFGNWEPAKFIHKLSVDTDLDASIGEMVGDALQQFPDSLSGICYSKGVPITFHLLVGADVNHQNASVDPFVFERSYADFLTFAESVRHLEGGVFINIGSQVTGPEIFLKSLSMARNVAGQKGEQIHDFHTVVLDMFKLPDDWRTRLPREDDQAYYFRPWKTLLRRTVGGGGTPHYICGNHTKTIPNLWLAIRRDELDGANSGEQTHNTAIDEGLLQAARV